ncbi:MAG: cytochrome c-type biogenesis protein CcmH [Bacteroidota bacterium]
MLRKSQLPVVLLVAFVFSSEHLWAQAPPTLQEIKTNLTCLCGCNMTVEACQGSMACQSADKLTAEAQEFIDQGLGKSQILATFVSRYGEHTLSAPTKKGFNLTAWITPFAAIIITGYGIVKILRRWARRSKTRRLHEKQSKKTDPKYEKMLDEMLHDLD